MNAPAVAQQLSGAWTNLSDKPASTFGSSVQAPISSDRSLEVMSAELHAKLSNQLDSPIRDEQIFALKYLRQFIPSSSLRAKVKTIAEQSPDPIVQGYARLLAADWNVPVIANSIEMNFGDATPAQAVDPTNQQNPTAKSNSAVAPQPPPARSWPSLPAFGSTNSANASSLPADATLDDIRPDILDRPIDAAPDALVVPEVAAGQGFLAYEREAPLGFTGPSSVCPIEFQQSDHFVPIADRWRSGFSSWDRYGNDHPTGVDYPYKEGNWLDPYNQNVLKGDYPIIGQHTFYNITAQSLAVHEFRQTPTATTPFESTRNPFSGPFFGDPDQFFYAPNFKFTFELFHGNAAFKPVDWKFHLSPVFNVNNLDVQELAIVNPDVRQGTNRLRDDFSLEEWFVEAKLADIGPDYDFVSARVGSQLFVSDFRGFVFRDVNRAVRLFGTRLANRDQFNVVWLDQAEKDTNSELNTFDDRHQNVVILNYFRQDFVFPGYTAQASFLYNHDKPSFRFDDNDVLVRPDPVGIFKEHEINSYYIGFGGDGHIGRINVSNQVYVALGNDSSNPIGGTSQQINAQMAAIELSYDRDWIRFRSSYFFASGDDDPNDGRGEGFDTIMDDPIFAGGEFSYWQRQSIRLFGTNLVQRKSIVPDLRSSKIQGQSNFVNPGLHLFNLGMDFEVTPKTRIVTNANYLYFDETAVLETYTFQNKIARGIGTDLSAGLEFRPLLNDNAIIILGLATLIPASGLKDLYGTELPPELANIGIGNELRNEIPRFTSTFCELVLAY